MHRKHGHSPDLRLGQVCECGVQGTPEGVEDNGSLTRVAAFPIGIDPERFQRALERMDVQSNIAELLNRYAGRKVRQICTTSACDNNNNRAKTQDSNSKSKRNKMSHDSSSQVRESKKNTNEIKMS